MWDVHTGNCVRVFLGHTNSVNCLAVSPDGRWLASGGEDGIICVWDIGSGRRLKSMRGHARASLYSLAFSRDGTVLVSGCADNSVRVWDVKRIQMMLDLNLKRSTIMSMATKPTLMGHCQRNNSNSHNNSSKAKGINCY